MWDFEPVCLQAAVRRVLHRLLDFIAKIRDFEPENATDVNETADR
jgi:hypothetical protein